MDRAHHMGEPVSAYGLANRKSHEQLFFKQLCAQTFVEVVSTRIFAPNGPKHVKSTGRVSNLHCAVHQGTPDAVAMGIRMNEEVRNVQARRYVVHPNAWIVHEIADRPAIDLSEKNGTGWVLCENHGFKALKSGSAHGSWLNLKSVEPRLERKPEFGERR